MMSLTVPVAMCVAVVVLTGHPVSFFKTRAFKKTRLKSLILRLNKAKNLKSYRLKLFVWHA